jgi:ribonuclease VapC
MSTTVVVLDASAILAYLFREPGAEKLTDEILEGAVVSTVNLAEVQSKLVSMNHDPGEAWEDALSLGTAVEPFTQAQARVAGTLMQRTKSHGLSLGDRSCLALAIALKAPVYTTERIWKGLNLGVPIHLLR